MISKRCLWLFVILGLILGQGCVTMEPYGSQTREEPVGTYARKTEQPAAEREMTQKPPAAPPESVRKKPETPPPSRTVRSHAAKPSEDEEDQLSQDSSGMSNQELLESALDFCQVSNDFWEQGDLDNALDALDKAYSLILRIKEDGDQELQQQKEDLRITIAKRIMEVYASRYTVANGHHKAIPLDMNAHVQKALDLFTGKGRESSFFLSAYRRSGRYRPAIVAALHEAGLPEELSWLPLIESGYKIRALSSARALGLWQFIASTGYKFGLKRDPWIDERMDPEKSTKAAISYLKELHQIFGDWTTVLAAYNCGERRVLNTIKTQRINYLDNFWDLYQRLPSETAFYVPKFLAVLHILNNPAKYGITLPPVDPEIRTQEVTINKQVHLKTIADRLNIDYEVIRDMNAELRQQLTPPEGPYQLKVPEGQGEILLAKLGDIPVYHPPVPQFLTHRVARGDSLSGIADRYKTSVRAIMAANGLKKTNYLKVGWKLKIPTREGARIPASAAAPVVALEPREKLVEYEVKKGDSLYTIANQYKTTTKAIMALNRLKTSDLAIGQVLMISPGGPAYSPGSTKSYRVRKGDSPYLIAKKHGMSLSDFLRLNKMTPRSTIYPGQRLMVTAR